MRASIVVILDPVRDAFAGVFEAVEQGLVEEFVVHPAGERLVEPVLRWLAGCDELPSDAVILGLA
jgi:hypothetical protein